MVHTVAQKYVVKVERQDAGWLRDRARNGLSLGGSLASGCFPDDIGIRLRIASGSEGIGLENSSAVLANFGN